MLRRFAIASFAVIALSASAHAQTWASAVTGSLLQAGAIGGETSLGLQCSLKTRHDRWLGEMVFIYADGGQSRPLKSVKLTFDNGKTVDIHDHGPTLKAERGKVRVAFGPDRARFSWFWSIAKNVAAANSVTVEVPELGIRDTVSLKGSSRAIQPILNNECHPIW
ncbi:MAG: hypothetical protein AAGA88_05575 [Pseudomonadota bacterium]